MKKLIIFDMDDVLYHYDYMARRMNLSKVSGVSVAHIGEYWFEAGKENRAEAGFHSNGDEYLEDFNNSLGTSYNRQIWIDCRRRAMSPIATNLALAADLKAKGHEIAILTNNGALIYEEMKNLSPEAYEIFGENSYCSWNFGARKPSAQVFARAILHLGYDASDTYFIDDLAENVKGAAEVGIKAIHFTPHVDLREKLSELL